MDILAADGSLLARQLGARVRLVGRKDLSISIWGGGTWPVRLMDFYAHQGALSHLDLLGLAVASLVFACQQCAQVMLAARTCASPSGAEAPGLYD